MSYFHFLIDHEFSLGWVVVEEEVGRSLGLGLQKLSSLEHLDSFIHHFSHIQFPFSVDVHCPDATKFAHLCAIAAKGLDELCLCVHDLEY